MKTVTAFFLAAWMAVWPLGANPLSMLAGSPPVATPWTFNTGAGSGSSTWIHGSLSSRTYVAWSFTAPQTGSVNSCVFSMRYVGSPTTESFSVELWSDNGGGGNADGSGLPSTLLTAMATGVLYSSLSTGSYANKTITFTTPGAVTSGTRYWLVVHIDQAFNATNYIEMQFNSTNAVGGQAYKSTGAWVLGDASCSWRDSVSGLY